MELQENSILDLEQQRCFKFFWEQANQNLESMGAGLILDNDNPKEHKAASIASVGFGLNAIVIGVQNKWISFEEGYVRVLATLKTLWYHGEHVEGFFYHFLDMNTAKRYGDCEASIIDTSILVNGALIAGQYFKGACEEYARKIYERVNWPFYYDQKKQWFYMSYDPKRGHLGQWDVYGEQLMMYILAAGSPTYPLDDEGYYHFKRLVGSCGPYTFVYSWFGSLFTHQFSHAWFPFQNYRDALGMDWFENSVIATKANREYCIQQRDRFPSFGPNNWGLTACDGPNLYEGRYGSQPSGAPNGVAEGFTDGTIAPAAALGSVAFCYEEVHAYANHLYQTKPELFGRYGFYDAYNDEVTPPWHVDSVIGIDKGITCTMIENQKTGLIWKLYEELDVVQNAIAVLRFKKV